MSFLPRSLNNDVVLIKLDAIGDFIIWLGCAEHFKNHFPNNIHLVCNQVVADIAFASGFFHSIIPVNLKLFQTDFLYRLRILRRVRGSLAVHLFNLLFLVDFF